MPRYLIVLAFVAIAGSSRTSAADARGVEFFESKIRPVLVEHCASCHSAKARKTRGELSLDSRAAMLKGGETGPALVPNKPEASLLLKAVHHQGDLKMPPKKKLSAKVIADLTTWIRMGAPVPEENPDSATAAIDMTKGRQFWSFQPVRRPMVPVVKNTTWVHNPIDRFILARLEAQRLTPAIPAERRTLLRRVSFDLIGLPPTPEQVEAFLGDDRPGAFGRLVERLLADPAHGEHWARRWLDVARYAEDQAHTFAVVPNTQAWRYRDWVIAALNTDMPYDRFVQLQIAADLMPDATLADRPALGLFGLGAQYYRCSNPAKAISDEIDDRVDTLTRGFLGLTVACARCHDHKFDPIPTQDYYSLAGVFTSSRLANLPLVGGEELRRHEAGKKRIGELDNAAKMLLKQEKTRQVGEKVEKLAVYLGAAWRVRASGKSAAAIAKQEKLDPTALTRLVALIDPAKRSSMNLGSLAAWRKPIAAGQKELPADLLTAAKQLQERLLPFIRTPKGRSLKPEESAALQALVADNKGAFDLPEPQVIARMSSGVRQKLKTMRGDLDRLRREQKALPVAHGLAEAKPADLKVFLRGNPMTQGPVAPRRFLRVLSNDDPTPFRQGSGRLELAQAIASKDNPLTARVMVNRLWMHHFGRGLVGTPSNFGLLGERPTHPELLDWLAAELVDSGWSLKHIHRLIVTSATYQQSSLASAESIHRDPDNRHQGRANRRRLEVEAWRDALLAVTGELNRELGGPTFDLGNMSHPRRTVYARISRHELNPLLRLFDFPDANITAEKRNETTVPQQQLFVMNSPFMIDRARILANRLSRETNDAARIRRAYALVLDRPPDEGELRLGQLYLTLPDDPTEMRQNQLSRMVRYAQVLLAGNEFMYVD